MKHRVYGRILGRDKNERTQLFKNLVRSLFLWEKIETTEAKAKAVKGIVDKLITQAKSPNTRRLISQFLTNKAIEEKLVKDITPRLKSRTSGYTSITKIGKRLGDGAMIVQMRLLVEGEARSVKSVESVKPVKSVKTETVKTPLKKVAAKGAK